MTGNMPRFLLVALVLLASAYSGLGQVCTLGGRSSVYRPQLDQDADTSAAEITRKIGEAFTPVCTPKCPTVVVFRNSTAPNASTFVASGSMKIVYSPSFFTTLNNRYGNDGVIGIIAHEYGHVIDAVNVGSWMLNTWTPELRADAWAGCACGAKS